jgi:hypothetical protein
MPAGEELVLLLEAAGPRVLAEDVQAGGDLGGRALGDGLAVDLLRRQRHALAGELLRLAAAEDGLAD